ncbi:unnamed protein product [Euphydryas editha]|uniref:Tc1-like transposase DDE domain-containing protein n=1 Tax=Euphydryas editha TaxID=104508 RepID=A0AAU9UD56_EUPED|nr:unnamed protein product [Euphydryas editha]
MERYDITAWRARYIERMRKNRLIEKRSVVSQSQSVDYHDDMNATNFLKWMTEMVVPYLPEKSLVVMNNAPYHCTQINKARSSVEPQI